MSDGKLSDEFIQNSIDNGGAMTREVQLIVLLELQERRASSPAAGELVDATKALLNRWEPEQDGGTDRRVWEEGWAALRAFQGLETEPEFETVEEANAAGVFSGMLANGDTFGDEDDGPEGGHLEISDAPAAGRDGDWAEVFDAQKSVIEFLHETLLTIKRDNQQYNFGSKLVRIVDGALNRIPVLKETPNGN